MDCTKESNEDVPILPVAYSQGYVYASVARQATAENSNVNRPTEQEQQKPTERETLPYAQIAIGAVAGLVGPFVGATVFLLLSGF